jgi:hypothetical protein
MKPQIGFRDFLSSLFLGGVSISNGRKEGVSRTRGPRSRGSTPSSGPADNGGGGTR